MRLWRTILRNQRGFTLIEMMIVVVIVTILVAVGGTFLHAMQPTMKLNSAADALWADLNLARMVAIRRSAITVFEWHSHLDNGYYEYQIYVDFDNNGAYSDDDLMIRRYQSPKGIVPDSANNAIITFAFDPRGYFGVYNGGSISFANHLFSIKIMGSTKAEDSRAVLVRGIGTMRYYRNASPQAGNEGQQGGD